MAFHAHCVNEERRQPEGHLDLGFGSRIIFTANLAPSLFHLRNSFFELCNSFFDLCDPFFDDLLLVLI